MIYRVFSDAITLGCDNIPLVEDYGIGHALYCSVPQIRPPPFATLALVQNAGGGLIRGMRQFLSRLRPPFQ